MAVSFSGFEAQSLDSAVLGRLIERTQKGRAASVLRLIDVYVREATRDLARLAQAHQEGDGATVRWVAHQLNGGSGLMGAVGVVSLCAQIEALDVEEDMAGVLPLIHALEGEFATVRDDLSNLAARLA